MKKLGAILRSRVLLFAIPLVMLSAADAAKPAAQASTAPHFQLLWLNGKPACPPGSKLVTSAQGKPSCVAIQTSARH
jgi:hypothetical protein